MATLGLGHIYVRATTPWVKPWVSSLNNADRERSSITLLLLSEIKPHLSCAVDNLRAQGHLTSAGSCARHSEGTKKIGKKGIELLSFEKQEGWSDACVLLTDSAGRKVTLSDEIAEFGGVNNKSIIHEWNCRKSLWYFDYVSESPLGPQRCKSISWMMIHVGSQCLEICPMSFALWS